MHKRNEVKRPPGYELFFRPLEVVLNPRDYERVRTAYIFSKYGHAGKPREDGSRVFDHPKSAAWIYISELGGRDSDVIIVILLHDISEDEYLLSPYRISLNFGVENALDLGAVTKLPEGKETTEEYLARVIARGARAILAKLCDRLHNLRNLRRCTKQKRVRQIRETQRYHLRLLIPALRKWGEPWSEYADMLERKMHDAILQYR